MKVLLVGSGGREHALAWALGRSPSVSELHLAPGSDGMAADGLCHPISVSDLDGLARLARERGVDLVVVGPEAPLVAGLADRLGENGVPCFGPERAGARLEGSKAFTKEILAEAGVRSASYAVVTSVDDAAARIDAFGTPVVVKADGLAAGKGVCVTDDPETAKSFARDALAGDRFGEAGRRLLIESYLAGDELSVFAVTNGEDAVLFPVACDYKRLQDGGRGPNTGGMGSHAPEPVPESALELIRENIVLPVLGALRRRGVSYRGVLYCGLMWTANGPEVLEFNCRFGDPETQALLPLVEGDLALLFHAAATGDRIPSLAWRSARCVCVVIAAPGYPDSPARGIAIAGMERAASVDGAGLFHAGTRLTDAGWESAGGRVLNVFGVAESIGEAREIAYRAVDEIELEGALWRTDIGLRHLHLGREEIHS